jgi:hypothetical protein
VGSVLPDLTAEYDPILENVRQIVKFFMSVQNKYKKLVLADPVHFDQNGMQLLKYFIDSDSTQCKSFVNKLILTRSGSDLKENYPLIWIMVYGKVNLLNFNRSTRDGFKHRIQIILKKNCWKIYCF